MRQEKDPNFGKKASVEAAAKSAEEPKPKSKKKKEKEAAGAHVEHEIVLICWQGCCTHGHTQTHIHSLSFVGSP